MKLLGKRAVSPLIATVLLIAFAVALGAVVMNWSYDYAPESYSCDEVLVKFETLQGAEDICFDPVKQQIQFTLANQRSIVEHLKINVIGTQGSFDVEQPVILETGDIRKLAVSYDALALGSPQKLVVQPVFIRSDGEHMCLESRISSENIRSC